LIFIIQHSGWALHALETDPDLPLRVHRAARAAGALLSAFTLTADSRYLERGADLLRRAVPAYHTPLGLPFPFVNLWGAEVGHPGHNADLYGTPEHEIELRDIGGSVLVPLALGRLINYAPVARVFKHAAELVRRRGPRGTALRPDRWDPLTAEPT
jgi:hypothetical protein